MRRVESFADEVELESEERGGEGESELVAEVQPASLSRACEGSAALWGGPLALTRNLNRIAVFLAPLALEHRQPVVSSRTSVHGSSGPCTLQLAPPRLRHRSVLRRCRQSDEFVKIPRRPKEAAGQRENDRVRGSRAPRRKSAEMVAGWRGKRSGSLVSLNPVPP